jgi:hypothetical protein
MMNDFGAAGASRVTASAIGRKTNGCSERAGLV